MPISGSIPANAGEPTKPVRRGFAFAVDPRERGGATVKMNYSDNPWGRSPRTRGSRSNHRGGGLTMWSIPANAGEP